MYPDPGTFAADAVDPAVAAFNGNLARLIAAQPPIYTQDPQRVRRLRADGQSIWGPVVLSPLGEDHTIPGPLSVRVLTPPEVEGVYLHLHGGGWVLGSADFQDPLLEALAIDSRQAVVSVEYRLAPEHPFPAAVDDCETAALWLAETAKQEFGTDRLTIGGESAGAHLAALTLLRMRDRHAFTGFQAANLVYGVYDLTPTPSRFYADDPVLDGPTMAWFADQFVSREVRRNPDVSPLYAELHDLPPALFTVGTLDPLLDDSLFMHARWVAAGNRAELAVYPGGVHGFNAFPISIGEAANARINQFLRAAVTEPARHR